MINEEIQGHIDTAQKNRSDARKLLASGDFSAADAKFHEALAAIDVGITHLESEEPPDRSDPIDDDRELATLFADLLGIRGGIYRDMVPLDPKYRERAEGAYDAGAKYERDFRLKSTYNFVNQLVLRFLNEPGLLANPETFLTIEGSRDSVADWLRRAYDHVAESLPRRDDRAWALADLVLLGALRSSAELTTRLAQFERQVKSDRDEYPYTSLLRVVRDLARATEPNLPAGLRELSDWLNQRVSK